MIHHVCRDLDLENLLKALNLMKDADFDLNVTTNRGHNAFHYLAFNKSLNMDSVVHFLVDHGVDINEKSGKGETPLDLVTGILMTRNRDNIHFLNAAFVKNGAVLSVYDHNSD